MARTPDRFPGIRREEGIVLDSVDDEGNPIVDPIELGSILRRNSDDRFRMLDGQGVFNPRETSVSVNDNTSGFLENKIIAGSGIQIAKINPGGSEQLVLSSTAAAGVQEVPFENSTVLFIDHQRHYHPLVQVIVGAFMAWNMGGWNNVPWNGDFSGYIRLPDDQYVTTHDSDDVFWVEFSSPQTGRVLYF